MSSQDTAWKMNPRLNLANRKFKDEYDLKEELGKGAFGVVRRCVLKSDKSGYAVKMNNTPDKRESMDFEFIVSKRLCYPTGHINIINMFDSILEGSTRFNMYELASGGDVMEDIMDRQYYSERDASFAIEQVVKGVAFIHSKGYLHRDLKPENLLLKMKKSNIIKITDFGLAVERKKWKQKYYEFKHGMAGTPSYWSPEVATYPYEPYDTDADMFSCGVILYQLIGGYLPFWNEDYSVAEKNLMKLKFSYPTPEWDKLDSAKQLISGLLCAKKKRLTASDVLKHPFITSRATTTSTENRPQIIDAFKLFQEKRQRKVKLLETYVKASKNDSGSTSSKQLLAKLKYQVNP